MKIFKILANVVTVLILSILIIFISGLLLGYGYYFVQSGSMEPEIPVRSIIIVDRDFEYEDVEVGDVIVYAVGDIKVTHRVIEITEKGLITKGDANDVPDGIPVTSEQFKGKVVGHTGKVGI